jgi:hypothetical protein
LLGGVQPPAGAEGVGVGAGGTDGVGVAGADGDDGVVAPVQAVPFSVKDDGVAGVPAPWKPKVTLPPVAIVALWPAFTAVAWLPLWVTVAFQAWLTVSPRVKGKASRQPATGSPRLVICTSAVNPLSHRLATV